MEEKKGEAVRAGMEKKLNSGKERKGDWLMGRRERKKHSKERDCGSCWGL